MGITQTCLAYVGSLGMYKNYSSYYSLNFFFRITKMPRVLECCKDNVQACFVLGMVFAGLNILFCLFGDASHILSGIYGALVSGILIYGAHKRNRTAILIWMVLTIIGVIGLIVVSVLAIIFVSDSEFVSEFDTEIDAGDGVGIVVLSVIIAGIFILFDIWTIIVAKRARAEIHKEATGENGTWSKA